MKILYKVGQREEILRFKLFDDINAPEGKVYKEYFKQIVDAQKEFFFSEIKIKHVKNYIKLMDSDKFWGLTLLNYGGKGVNKLLDFIAEKYKEDINMDIDQEELEKHFLYHESPEEYEKYKEDVGSLGFIKGFNMKDTGMRIAAFRKGNDIIVAYRKKNLGKDGGTKKILPEEFDLLKIVHAKLSFENKGCTIRYVGYNDGGELAFLNSLIYSEDATLFLTKKSAVHDMIDFTEHDLDKDKEYQDNFEIVAEGFDNIAKEIPLEILTCFLLSQGIIPGIAVIISTEILGALKKLIHSSG